jgi:hypothetical protein
MPIQLPSQFHSLREVAALSNTSFRLDSKALAWCDLNQTGGLIPKEDFALVSAGTGASERHAAECERTGAWHDARYDCGSEFCLGPVDADAWIRHDFFRCWVSEQASAPSADAAALGKRRASDAARKQRQRDREAAFSTGPKRKRGRPKKKTEKEVPAPVRPQVKNTSRDASRDGHVTTVIDRSNQDPDFDFGLDPGQSVSQVEDRNAGARESEKPELVAAVADVISAKIGHVPADPQVLVVIATVRKRAEKAGNVIRDPMRYIPKSVANEPDLYAGLLYGDPPSLAEVLADPPSPVPKGEDPSELHDYDLDTRTGVCREPCNRPRANWRHQPPATEAKTA